MATFLAAFFAVFLAAFFAGFLATFLAAFFAVFFAGFLATFLAAFFAGFLATFLAAFFTVFLAAAFLAVFFTAFLAAGFFFAAFFVAMGGSSSVDYGWVTPSLEIPRQWAPGRVRRRDQHVDTDTVKPAPHKCADGGRSGGRCFFLREAGLLHR